MSSTTSHAVRRSMNLVALLTQTARRIPNNTAVVCGPLRWSWRDLDDKVSALAIELRLRGVSPGDCVLVHSLNHIEYIQAMFAIWRVGAVLAPTNARITPHDAAGIAGVCQPVALICQREFPEHAAVIASAVDLRAGTLWIGGHGPDSLADLPIGHAVADAPVHTDDHAWYFFTSGTSGTPKAAILTHMQMSFVVTNHLADLMPGTVDSDVSLVVAPLSHGAGVHMLPQIARGATSVLTASASMDCEEVWALVEQEKVTNVFTVPTILKKLVDHPACAERDHSSLRYVIYAGAPMYSIDQERARVALGDVLVQYYGLGEVTGNITVLPPADHGRPRPAGMDFGSCGRPRTGMHVAICGDDGQELAVGEQGEICVAGPAVCAGYLNNDDANAAAFRDGWFRTGDLGKFDDEGYLYITGRASDMYISGGSNVYPREIEEKLLKHPDVAEVAVLGIPDPVWGEIGVAVWVAAPGAAINSDELQQWVSPHIARYKLPRHFLQWPALPMSGYGKIEKKVIKTDLIANGVRREQEVVTR